MKSHMMFLGGGPLPGSYFTSPTLITEQPSVTSQSWLPPAARGSGHSGTSGDSLGASDVAVGPRGAVWGLEGLRSRGAKGLLGTWGWGQFLGPWSLPGGENSWGLGLSLKTRGRGQEPPPSLGTCEGPGHCAQASWQRGQTPDQGPDRPLSAARPMAHLLTLPPASWASTWCGQIPLHGHAALMACL